MSNPTSRNEAYLLNALGESHDLGNPRSRIEVLLDQLVTAIQQGGGSADGVKYVTEAPTRANTDGDLKFVVLETDPVTKYAGYIYIITGGL